MPARFTWDRAKAEANRRKHNVSFEEALGVFGDPLARIHEDRTIRSESVGRSSLDIPCRAASLWYPSPSVIGRSGSSALVERLAMNAKTMKRTRDRRNRRRATHGLAREYRFDYSKSKRNRFAGQVARDTVIVVLESDVARVFRDPKRVNALLRATIAAVGRPRSRRTG